ncbi:DUF5955 family protein [Streptomyces sp. NPDC058045]|uniref:DUF5955 family protein n=1 Tax=Streptomyces sp. NPDC058045 TaxID=3346311 RepID=UPI0036E8EFCB
MGRPAVAGGDGERAARIGALQCAIGRLRGELAAHPAEFIDRAIAEDELAVLAGLAREQPPQPAALRRSLLVVAAAVGSVSALAGGLAEVRVAVDLLDLPAADDPRTPQPPYEV